MNYFYCEFGSFSFKNSRIYLKNKKRSNKVVTYKDKSPLFFLLIYYEEKIFLYLNSIIHIKIALLI